MNNNLADQIEWLNQNLYQCHIAGFNYAPNAAREYVKPERFFFENLVRKNSKNASLSSISQLGLIDLECFRKENSPIKASNRHHPYQSEQVISKNVNSNLLSKFAATLNEIPESNDSYFEGFT